MDKNTAFKPAPARAPKPRYAVIGGLGAVAGADILHRIVKSTPASSDSEHLDIAFIQRPFCEAVSPADVNYDPTHRKFYVYDTLKEMEADGRDVVLLPCFVSQTFLHEITPEISLQVLSIADAVSQFVHKNYPSGRIGVLTSNYVRQTRRFEKIFGDDYEIVYPTDQRQAQLMDTVYGKNGIKSGNFSTATEDKIREVCLDLVEQGADFILPGFTDIPVMLEQFSDIVPVPILNSNQIYADFAVAFASQYKREPFKIGIVGGVGPAATTDFMSKVISNTNAARDQDHIKMVVEQNPQIPDRTENILNHGDDPTIAIYSCCKKLEKGGANIIAIPCNTAHAFVDRIQRHLSIPIINMLSETVDLIKRDFKTVTKVGLLATSGTVASGLYQAELDEAGLKTIVPKDVFQSKIMEAIYGELGVKGGFDESFCIDLLMQAYTHLEQNGAELVILGCTELPLIAPKIIDKNRPALLDPTEILAKKCVKLAGGGKVPTKTDWH